MRHFICIENFERDNSLEEWIEGQRIKMTHSVILKIFEPLKTSIESLETLIFKENTLNFLNKLCPQIFPSKLSSLLHQKEVKWILCKSIKFILRFRRSKFSHLRKIYFFSRLSPFYMQSYQTPQKTCPYLTSPSLLPSHPILIFFRFNELAKLNAFLPRGIKFFIELLIRVREGRKKSRKWKEWKRNGNILQPSFIYSIKAKIQEQMEYWSSPLKDIPDTLNENIMIKRLKILSQKREI